MATLTERFRFAAVSRGAVMVGLSAALMIASAFRDARLQLGPLRLHLALVGLALAAPLARGKWSKLPRSIALPMLAFLGFFSISAMVEGSVSEPVKLASFVFSFWVVCAAVNTRDDVIFVTLGLCACGVFICVRNVLAADTAGGLYYDEAMDGLGNKNAFSLYYLPGLVMAAWAWLVRPVRGVVKHVATASVLFISLASLVGANRSGWLGVGLVGVAVVVWRGSPRAVAAVLVTCAVIYLSFDRIVSADAFRVRVQQTAEGHTADDLRQELFRQSMEIALENPVLGLGPTAHMHELARRALPELDRVDPHNAFGAAAGGAGLFALLALVWWMLALLRAGRKRDLLPDAAWLVTWVTLMWITRSLFTQETLYTPAFAIALGASAGYAFSNRRVNQAASSKGQAAARSAPSLIGADVAQHSS